MGYSLNYMATCEVAHFFFFLVCLAVALSIWIIYSLYRWHEFYMSRRWSWWVLLVALSSHMIGDYANLGF